MSPRTIRWFWAIIAAQAVFLLAWAGYHEIVRTRAPVVRLKVRPVDPREPIRGDFMQLRYEIADVQPEAVKRLPIGSEAWVVLERHGAFDEAVTVASAKPALSPEQIAVRAKRGWSGLEFGIERYYVPEGQGTPRFKTIEVEAAVGPGGRLYVRRLRLDGKDYP